MNKVIKNQPKDKQGFRFSLVHKIVPLLIIIVAMTAASNKTAKDLNYDSNFMGKPSFFIEERGIYPFYAIVRSYLVALRNGNVLASNVIYENFKGVANGSLVAVLIYFMLVFLRRTHDKWDKTLFTKNRWGNKKDLEKVGLLAESGVVLGQSVDAKVKGNMKNGSCHLDVKKCGYLVQYDTNVSSLVIAGSRLGKGVSTVVPTHLSFPYSIISIDPKGENYELTAGFRSKFSYVYKFNPVDRETLCFNVMDEIDEQFAYRDANMIAQILTSPENPNTTSDPHWRNSACVLLTASILHIKCSDYEDKSLPGVYKFLTSVNKPSDDKDKDNKENPKKTLLMDMIRGNHCSLKIHEQVSSLASQIYTAADTEMSSIFSSALTALAVFNDPLVANAVSKSDFCLEDFKKRDKPISWYLTIPFSDLDRLKCLLRLIIEFVCRKFSQGLVSGPGTPLKNRILFLIDEFPTLGHMPTIETFAGILNGYGISFLWIAQSKSQIDKLYGHDSALYEHCRYITTYAVGDVKSAEYFSNRIGKEGVIKQNSSNNGSRYDVMMNNMSVSRDISERSLLTANEIESLPCEYEIILSQGGLPQLCKKVAYYSDKRFKDKVNLKKPETRAEMLIEAKGSFVSKVDKSWCDHIVKRGLYDEDDTVIEHTSLLHGVILQQ